MIKSQDNGEIDYDDLRETYVYIVMFRRLFLPILALMLVLSMMCYVSVRYLPF